MSTILMHKTFLQLGLKSQLPIQQRRHFLLIAGERCLPNGKDAMHLYGTYTHLYRHTGIRNTAKIPRSESLIKQFSCLNIKITKTMDFLKSYQEHLYQVLCSPPILSVLLIIPIKTNKQKRQK